MMTWHYVFGFNAKQNQNIENPTREKIINGNKNNFY